MVNNSRRKQIIKDKMVKLLVILSISIPLLIILVTMLRDGKQIIIKLTQWRDYQLLQKVNSAISSLQGEIALKSNININKRNKQHKNPLEVYDKIFFNIYMFNVNSKQPPINRQRLLGIELLIIKYFKQYSYIKDIISRRNEGTIIINIKPSHISQIQHNYQNKLIKLYLQQFTNNQHYNVNNIKTSEYQINSIIQQLRNINKQKNCHYQVSNTKCKDYIIYVLYDDNFQTEQDNSMMNQQQYWSSEDYKETVIVLPIKQSLLTQNSLQLMNFITILQELIYESLDISQLFQHTQQSLLNDPYLLQNEITQFIHFHQMHKQLEILKQLQLIINNTEIPYQRINYQQKQLLMNDLSAKLVNNNINDTTLNRITRIDTFPTDYKLGVLAPIAIILLYPLLNLIPYLRI